MAKGFITEFLVKVGSVGLSKTKKDVDQLATSTQKVGDAHATAGKSAREHFNTQDKGIIGTANSTRSFSKLSQTINGGGSSSVVGAYATLAANVFALTAAFNALKAAAAMQQIERGLEALGNRTGQTLSIAANGLKEITGNAISTEQALRSSAQVFSAGFDGSQLERLGKVANDASFALGRNMTDSMDRLTRGVIKLEPELLDELGIMTRLGDATKAYAAELGKSESSLTTMERRQAFFNAVMAEGELKFGGLAAEAGNTKAFDQLSASLSDLTKQTLNLINKAALPLAAIFSSSPAALIGGALLFASTIRSQLLPGLSELQNKSIQTSKTLADQAKKQKDSLTALRGKAEVTEESAFFSALDLKSIKDGPKGYNKFIAEIGEGTVEIEDQKAALKSLSTSITYNEKELAKMPAGTKAYDIRTAKIRELKAAQDQLTRAIYDQTAAQRILTQTKAQATIVERNLAVTTAQASAQRNAGTAIELASMGKVPEGYKVMSTAIKEYHSSQVIATKGAGITGKAMGGLKTATFAAGTAAKFAGAAFLNFIPIIGQVIFFAGLLYAAYKGIRNSLETKGQKEYNKAMKELGEILDTLSKKAQEYEKTQRSTANAYLRQAQSLTLLSNVSNEIADKLDEANAAYAKKLKDQERLEKDSYYTRLQMLENLSDQVADPATKIGMKIGSTIAEWTMKKWSGIELTSEFNIFRDFDRTVTNSAGFKSYKELIEKDIPIMNKALEASLKKASGGMSLEEIDKLPDKTRQAKIFFDATREGIRVFEDLAPAIEATTQALKQADDAAGSFIKGLAISTSYDDLVKGYDAINLALIEQKELMQSAGFDAKEYYKTLSGIGTNMSKFLSQENRDTLSNYNKQDSIVQRLSVKEADKTISTAELKSLVTARAALKVEESRMDAVEAQVFERQGQFRLMKAEEEQSKRQLDLEKARMSAVASIYDTTAQGLKAQYEAEERIRGLQAQTIQSRGKVLDIIAEGNTLTAEEQATLTELSARRGALNKEETETYTKLFGKQVSISEVEAGRLGISTELSILAEQRLTTAQQEAQMEVRRVTILNNLLATRRQIAEVIAKTVSMEEQSNDLLQGRIRGVADEARELQRTNNLRKEAIRDEYNATKRRLVAEIEVANSVRSRGNLTSSELTAINAQVSALETQRQLAEAKRDADIREIDASERLERLNKSIFDIRTEGIEWQREGLSILEKEADLSSKILNSEIERSQSEDRRSKRILGLKITDSQETAYELEAEQKKYKLAVEQSALRRTMIDLEFALLDGQREIMKQQLLQRRDELQALGASSAHLAQLNNSIQILDNFDVEGVRIASQNAITAELETQRSNLRLLSTIQRSSDNDISSAVTGSIALAMARANARQGTQRDIDDSVREVGIETSTAITETLAPVKSAAVQTVEYLSAIDSNVAKLVEGGGATSAGSLTATTAAEAIVEAGKLIQSKGFRVSEQSKFGGNTGGHRGAGHREDRAIDVNIGTGNREWDNPVMKAKMDALAVELRAMGARVLWGVAGHFDHMHVEFKEGFTNQVAASKAIERAVQNTPTKIAEAVASTPEATNEPATQVADVVVTAKKAAPEVNFGWMETLEASGGIIDGFSEKLAKLGPQGELVMAVSKGAHSITTNLVSIGGALKEIDSMDLNGFQKSAIKFSTVADTVSSAIGTIANIAAASSNVKVEAIDREIAAEQKRDGKSAESLAKIQSMEAKKDAVAKKAFEVNKKLMMAQAIVSAASGVAMALASAPAPFNFALAAMVGAMGAAQLAIIAGTSYQSTSAPAQQAAMPTTLSVGKRSDTVDLAKNNANAGGEIGYLRGARGQGRSSADYAVIGSAYGGSLPRGYGNTGYLVGEHGPEIIKPEVPVSVQPANDNQQGNPVNATFNINALDASGVQDILHAQRGFIIGSLREAANANGQSFLENINTNVYTKPNVGRL